LLRNGEVLAEQFTGLDGRFRFQSVPAGSYVIRVQYPGYKVEEVHLNFGESGLSSRVPVTLQPDEKTLMESGSIISFAEINIPGNAKRQFEEGLKKRRRGEYSKALPLLQKAVTLYPLYGEAFNEMGVCFKALGDLNAAENAFKQAIRYNSTVYPSVNLADLYAEQRRFNEAFEVIRKSSAAHPTEGDLFFALARIYFDQERLKEAESAGLEAHSRSHRAADVHLLLAKIYLLNKNYPALITQLDTYLEENPDGPAADQVRQTLRQLSR
jgi:tetratricopeptide (TPR) repeat protein